MSEERTGLVKSKTVVVGPGAIGCLVASELHRHGLDTILLGRDTPVTATLAREGVRFSGVGGNRRVRLPVSCDTRVVSGADFVCICVKAYQTADVARQLSGLVSDGALVISLQNGLGNVECLQSQFRGVMLAAAVTSHGVTRLGVTEFRHAGQGMIGVAGDAVGVKVFAGLLRQAGFEVSVSSDIDGVRWRKVIVNAAINPVAALAGVPNGELLTVPRLLDEAVAAAREVAALAAKLGINLGAGGVAERVVDVCRRTSANRCSMLQDLEKGRRTEIDALNGAIARIGSENQVATPVNAQLTAAIKAREAE